MTASEELKAMIKKRDKVVAEMATNLLAELTSRTPVDTGILKASWELTKVGDGWLLSNNMDYASYIFNGIRVIESKQVGSKQLPDGVFPILQLFNRELQRRLDAL